MSNRVSFKSRIAVLVLLAGALASCSGGGQGLDPIAVQLFNFAPGFGGVHLNAPLELTFTVPVDPNSVTPDTVRIFTTTTTTQEPDPGAPAIGVFVVVGNVVRFLPRVPENADLSDTGLRLGFTYTIQVPASPDVISPIRSIEGDANLVSFVEFFTTLNTTILPAPGDIIAEPNLNSLQRFFIDEGIENGIDPCPRASLPLDAQDSPQVIDTDPDEGESGFGTITGIQVGLGTAFVRLDPITFLFSEPIGPWRIRSQNISIRNTNLGGETFDLFFFFTQDRAETRLQITVFDADSAFDQASVPQGRYILTLTEFTDLAGNPLVNDSCTAADGTFQLSFSTVSSPSLPTNLTLTFQDNDADGHVDVGGLPTAVNDPNEFPDHVAPFLGGVAVDQSGVTTPSPSAVSTTANWGNTAFWTGCECRFDNGFDPLDPGKMIPDSVRLRGGSAFAATPILAPIAGFGTGRSSASGSFDGSTTSATANLAAPPAGKVNFSLIGSGTAALFTGDLTTGPITYHYYEFELRTDSSGNRPLLTARSDSVFPLLIFVENAAVISGDVILDGGDGEFGYNGANDGSTAGLSRNPGGAGGAGIAGGGDGGDGGALVFGADAELLNGQSGEVPANVLGPLDQFDESVATIITNAPGGGGHWVSSLLADPTEQPDPPPVFQGGGGVGTAESGFPGADADASAPGESDQGVGGKLIGTGTDFSDAVGLAHGGAGGGGGGAEDDNAAAGAEEDSDDLSGDRDDGGGGGGAGGGFFGFTCGGDIDIGVDNAPTGGVAWQAETAYSLGDRVISDDPARVYQCITAGDSGSSSGPTGTGADITDDLFTNVAAWQASTTYAVGDRVTNDTPTTVYECTTAGDSAGSGGPTGTGAGIADNTVVWRSVSAAHWSYLGDAFDLSRAVIRVVGGRGASTYQEVAGDPPVPGTDAMADPFVASTSAIGQGNAGGGGGGGGICMIAGGQINWIAAEVYAMGKLGGNSSRRYVAFAVGLEEGGRTTSDTGGSGGAGVMMFLDSDGFQPDEIGLPVGQNIQVNLMPVPDRDQDEDGNPDLDEVADFAILHDLLEMDGTPSITHDIYGDDPKEIIFQPTLIVTEFFDTLSDSVSYDRVQILSNAPAFPYDTGTLANNVMRTFVDVVTTGPGGTPDLTTEDQITGDVSVGPNGEGGVTNEIGSHYNSFPPNMAGDPLVGAALPGPQYDSTFIIQAAGAEQGRRYVRVRLRFDLSKLGTLAQLLSSFAPGGFPPNLVAIADNPATTPIDNTLGNIDQAPTGVPAFAEIRVRFTP